MKRCLLLLAALTLLCASAFGEEMDYPMSAAECLIRVEDFVPTHTSEVPAPAVRFLPENMPVITSMSMRGSTVLFTLSGTSGFDKLTAEISMYAGEWLHLDDATLIENTDGQLLLRFSLPIEAMSGHVTSCTLIASYHGDGYDEVITVQYSCYQEPTVQTIGLTISSGDGEFFYRYNANGLLNGYNLKGPDGFFAGYGSDGALRYAYIYTENPVRTYYFGSSGMLQSLEDEERGISISYDWNSGVIADYDVKYTVPGASDTATISYLPYGQIYRATYDPSSAAEDIDYYVWSPVDGWYAITEHYQSIRLSDADALNLPDLSAITPPLPALDMPEFRLDVSSTAELPVCPVDVKALPQVLDFHAENGLVTATFDSPLALPEGAVLRLCEEYALSEWGSLEVEVYPATISADGMSLTAAVPTGPESDDLHLDITSELCLDIYYPAADASHFSFRYLYHPDSGTREITLDSPAAYFRCTLAPDRSISEAVCYERLTDLIAYGELTFDTATGLLTEYVYYVTPTFDKTGWYRVFYVPGEGIVKAWIGEGEGVFYEWRPETGWLNWYGEPTDKNLLDPLHFPYPYPFPESA